MSSAIIPGLFTVGNLFCGFLAIHYIVQGNFTPAAWLIVLGAALDNMDGKIARYIGGDTNFGIELDSLVDICTFGMAPALMIYYSHLNQTGWGAVIAFAFLLCGALRLARFNVLSLNEEKGDYYMGLPIPVAAVILTQYVVFTERSWQTNHGAPFAILLVLLLAALMVSRLEYDSMPNFRSGAVWDRLKQLYLGVSLILIIHPTTSKHFFFPITMLYIVSGLYRWVSNIVSNQATQHA